MQVFPYLGVRVIETQVQTLSSDPFLLFRTAPFPPSFPEKEKHWPYLTPVTIAEKRHCSSDFSRSGRLQKIKLHQQLFTTSASFVHVRCEKNDSNRSFYPEEEKG